MNQFSKIYLDRHLDEVHSLMKFRLHYDGPLRPSQPAGSHNQKKQKSLSHHKQSIRKVFHRQLKELWETNETLKNLRVCKTCGPFHSPPSQPQLGGLGRHEYVHVSEYMKGQFDMFGYSFMPLAAKEFSLLVDLDVLFLRKDDPGNAFHAGDIDNRIKTLIDALKMPEQKLQLGEYETPDTDEAPFYCLIQDDDQVSSFSVSTDRLLDTNHANGEDDADVKLIISVDVKPYNVTMFNLALS